MSEIKKEQAVQLLEDQGYILPTLWHIDDIRTIGKAKHKRDFSDSDCKKIATYLRKNHHRDDGVNTRTISKAITSFLGQELIDSSKKDTAKNKI